jgi:hemolysin III
VYDGFGFYTEKEELANTITHAVGAVLAVAGLYLLLVESRQTDIWKSLTCLIFGSSLIIAYSASALYHGVRQPERKRFWRSVDHVTIYFLIAGTYTPFVLIILPAAWGWSLFAIVWSLALFGTMIRVFKWRLPDHVSTAPYLAMGWVALAAIKPMIDYSLIHGWGMLGLLVLGGLCYSGGTIFYNKMDMPYNHAYWHLAVLAGSICHYFAVLYYVIPF